MIVGAYPSAKFFTVEGIADTPLYDNDSPFSNETYFDGSRIRTIPSGKELNEVILKQIGVDRSECWITDLVKVFLFKEGHVNRYMKLGKSDFVENRSSFSFFARRSLKWIEEEIEIANPYAIILLGSEVTATFFNINSKEAIKKLNGEIEVIKIKGENRNVISIPHPGILMRNSENNPWPKRFLNEIAPKVKSNIAHLKKAAT
jgi:uracil-DNA glycosylase